MSIKYGDLTVVYDKEEQPDIFTSLLMWFTEEALPHPKAKYIFLFDDGEICEADDKLDYKYNFLDSALSVIPVYFEKTINPTENINSKQIYFRKKNDSENPNCLSGFDQLFSLYSKYDCSANIKSDYNGIYYCHKSNSKKDVFGLIRIKSNERMPRFQFAYDSDEFTREEIVYLIRRIFGSGL